MKRLPHSLDRLTFQVEEICGGLPNQGARRSSTPRLLRMTVSACDSSDGDAVDPHAQKPGANDGTSREGTGGEFGLSLPKICLEMWMVVFALIRSTNRSISTRRSFTDCPPVCLLRGCFEKRFLRGLLRARLPWRM